MDKQLFLNRLFRLDGVANLAGGAALIAASTWLAPAIGLTTAWPLILLGLALVAYGEVHWAIARRSQPQRRTMATLIALDLVFAAAMLDLAITDPFGADPWARWLMAAAADMAAIAGLAKWYGARPLTTRQHTTHQPPAPNDTTLDRALHHS
jgi:hypothetical protein